MNLTLTVIKYLLTYLHGNKVTRRIPWGDILRFYPEPISLDFGIFLIVVSRPVLRGNLNYHLMPYLNSLVQGVMNSGFISGVSNPLKISISIFIISSKIIAICELAQFNIKLKFKIVFNSAFF